MYSMVFAVVASAPPFLLMNYYDKSKLAEQIGKTYPWVAQQLDGNPALWLLSVPIWAWICRRVVTWCSAHFREEPSGWDNPATILLQAIGNAVGDKRERFHKALVEATKQPTIDAANVFNKITQPEQQIRELMNALYTAFFLLLQQSGEKYPQLKVNLAVIKDGEVVDIKYHFPRDRPVRSTIGDLNNPRSTIREAVKRKGLVIVESTRDEGEKAKGHFAVTDESRKDEDGSLLCYPVTFAPITDVAFVLSVCHDQRASFRKRFRATYEKIFEQFASRLHLEYSLLGLKELIRNDDHAETSATRSDGVPPSCG